MSSARYKPWAGQVAQLEAVRGHIGLKGLEKHYGLLTEQEARKRIEFLSSPLDRSYIFTYYWGQRMLKALFALKPERRYWYTRLLTEAVTPTQIRQWMLESGDSSSLRSSE